MDTVVRWINLVAPFLASYPVFVRVLFGVWFFISAGLVLVLILVPHQSSTSENPETPISTAQSAAPTLTIKSVKQFGGQSANIQVRATVNGTEYVYPSGTAAEWLEVGPSMSPQDFALPQSENGYDLSFKLTVLDQGGVRKEYISQSVEHVTTFPHSGAYRVHLLNQGTRAAGVSFEIDYAITK